MGVLVRLSVCSSMMRTDKAVTDDEFEITVKDLQRGERLIKQLMAAGLVQSLAIDIVGTVLIAERKHIDP